MRPGGAAALSGVTQGRAEAARSVHAAVAGWPVAAGRVPIMAAANASILCEHELRESRTMLFVPSIEEERVRR